MAGPRQGWYRGKQCGAALTRTLMNAAASREMLRMRRLQLLTTPVLLLLLLKDFSLPPFYAAVQTVQPKCSYMQLAGIYCVVMHFGAAQHVARKQKSWL